MKERKYIIIYEYYKEKIREGFYDAGDQIPPEVQVAKKFSVSRLTANKAINILAEEGFVERTSGKGTFVTNKVLFKDMEEKSSFTKDMEKLSMTAGSELIDFTIVKASTEPKIQEYLQLEDDDNLYYFIRKRTGNGLPIALSYTYLAAKYIPEFNVNILNFSLYEYLKSIGIKTKWTDCEISAEIATKEQMQILNIEKTAMLKYAHISYLENDVPYEYIETYYIGSRYIYKFIG